MSKTYFSEQARGIMKIYTMTVLVASGILFSLSLFTSYIVLYYIGGILFLMPLLASFISNWIPKERITHEGKAVFISGCDTGFGHILAQRLDDLGFQIFAGCLFPEGDGANHLRKSGSKRLHVIGLDVTNQDSVEVAAKYVKENLSNNVLWAVVNNAGIAAYSDVHWTSIETFQRIIDVNTLGVVRVTKALLPKLKESKGRVITVASLAGRYALPRIGPYCMSKAAAIFFSDVLGIELYKWGIQVITIEPSFHRTPLVEKQQIAKYITNEWERAPTEVKELYSSDYPEKLIADGAFLSSFLSKSPMNVVSDIEDAVTAQNPEYCYTPGDVVQRFLIWFLHMLPKPIVLKIIYIYMDRKIQF